jgi:CDP-diacylglycerol---serine O-phosphatidyltransferase
MPDEPAAKMLPAAQASRIYFLPNLMTAGNLFCGFLAIIKCIQASFAGPDSPLSPAELYSHAVWFILAAVIFDSLDGRLARLGGRESLFGKEFDSIADIVSFGVAPALMVFFMILSPRQYEFFRQIGWFVGFIYLLCAAVRLARFNVITHPLVYSHHENYSGKDFVGLPVPAAAGMIVSLVLLLNVYELRRWAILLPALMLLIAYLMVSTVRYPSFKDIGWRTKTRLRVFVGLLILVALAFQFPHVVLVAGFLGYIFFGVVRHARTANRIAQLRRDRRAQRESSVNNPPPANQ